MNNKKNILITGGVGFIGSNLAERLEEEGHNVISLDNYSFGKKENEHEKRNLLTAISDLDLVYLRGPEAWTKKKRLIASG